MDIMSFEKFLGYMLGSGGNGLLEVSQLKRENPTKYAEYHARLERVDMWRSKKCSEPLTPENFLEMEKMADAYIGLMGEDA